MKLINKIAGIPLVYLYIQSKDNFKSNDDLIDKIIIYHYLQIV